MHKFLHGVWKFPLSSYSTLHRWVSRFECEPGVLHSVITLPRLKGESMDVRDRACVLSFDECSIAQEWNYDRLKDVSLRTKIKSSVYNNKGIGRFLEASGIL